MKLQSSLAPQLLVIIILVLSQPCIATPPGNNHNEWLQLPTSQLKAMGMHDFNNGGRKDTAMMCFTIIGNRFDKSMKLEDKEECVDAFMKLWAIYYYDFYNYPKCFECLTKAHDIANESGIKNVNIHIGFGCMYQTISEECNTPQLGTKALDYYKKALKAGIARRRQWLCSVLQWKL